ncbi:MAG: hypothetical protein ACKVJU_09205 [Verrucomicrobiales bacterium]
MNNISLVSEVAEWLARSGSPEDLEGVLSNLDVDAAPTTVADIAQLKAAVKRLAKDESVAATQRIFDLVDLGYNIEEESIIRQFETELVPLFHDYVRSVATRKSEQSEETVNFTVWTLDTLMNVGTKESGELVAELIASNFGAESSIWSEVFSSLDPELPTFEPVDTLLRKSPPTGMMGARLLELNNDLFFEVEPDSPISLTQSRELSS